MRRRKRSNIKNVLQILGWLLTLAIVVVCWVYGGNVPLEDQWPLYTGLRNTAGIVFGVLGAWIALLYPQALGSVFGGEADNSSERKIGQVRRLLRPMWYSTLILMVVLLAGLAEPILKQIDIFLQYRSVVRSASLALIGAATVLQVWSIMLVVIPADELDLELRREHQKNKRMRAHRVNRPGQGRE